MSETKTEVFLKDYFVFIIFDRSKLIEVLFI
jgi:hypothetical protein